MPALYDLMNGDRRVLTLEEHEDVNDTTYTVVDRHDKEADGGSA